MIARYGREIAAALVLAGVLIVLAFVAPTFFTPANLRDLLLNNVSTLITALGIMLVLLAGHIDISIASQFAICSVATGVLARAGVPLIAVLLLVVAIGCVLGALNGLTVTGLKAPSIVVTLATMIALRDALASAPLPEDDEGVWAHLDAVKHRALGDVAE